MALIAGNFAANCGVGWSCPFSRIGAVGGMGELEEEGKLLGIGSCAELACPIVVC